MYSLDSFKKGLEELEIELSEKQFQQFIAYYELLVEKNKVMNLTGNEDVRFRYRSRISWNSA